MAKKNLQRGSASFFKADMDIGFFHLDNGSDAYEPRKECGSLCAASFLDQALFLTATHPLDHGAEDNGRNKGGGEPAIRSFKRGFLTHV